MAVHVITGVMGSGKSYEAVSQKIVVALRDSKVRVVTNIEGLSIPELAKYLKKDEAYVASRLVLVDYDRVSSPGFWYDPEGGNVDTVVQPGDLVVLDEVWRYFPSRSKIPEDTMRFFRMHRHYVSEETRTSCEIVLINQALRGIHGDIRDVVEVQFQCRKLKALGRNNTYQVLVIEGGARSPSHRFTRNYSKDIFPLYSSYNSGSANVVETSDSRQSVFSSPFFKYVMPIALVLMAVSIYYTYELLIDGFGSTPKSPSTEISSEGAASKSSEKPSVIPTSTGPSILQGGPYSPDFWRVVATYRKGYALMAVLESPSGFRKTVPIEDYRYTYGDQLGVKPPATYEGYAYPYSGGISTRSPASPTGTSSPW